MTRPKVADYSPTLRRRQKMFWFSQNQRTMALSMLAFLVYFFVSRSNHVVDYNDASSGMDGCSVIGSMHKKKHKVPKIEWKPYTPKDVAILSQTQQCLKRIDHRKKEQLEDRSDVPLTTLKCQDDIDEPSTIISNYKEIHFIGDSVLRQQFMALCCWLDPEIQLQNTTSPSDSKQQGYVGTYQHGNKEQQGSTTILRYSHFGFLNHTKRTLYEVKHGLFPDAFNNASLSNNANDNAIVFNMGFHFNKDRAHTLHESAQILKDRLVSMEQHKASTSGSTPQVYYMETPDEQWPTSNGLFTKSCHGVCACEALTPERMEGNGEFSNIAARDVKRGIPIHIDDVFRPLYPDLFRHNQMDPKDDFYGRCVPDCLPANWRNELVHTVFNPPKEKNSHVIQTVPIWNQLVSQGVPHMVKHGDCTHKSSDSLILMNQQLLRQMSK